MSPDDQCQVNKRFTTDNIQTLTVKLQRSASAFTSFTQDQIVVNIDHSQEGLVVDTTITEEKYFVAAIPNECKAGHSLHT